MSGDAQVALSPGQGWAVRGTAHLRIPHLIIVEALSFFERLKR
jgi:hypothetical protein